MSCPSKFKVLKCPSKVEVLTYLFPGLMLSPLIASTNLLLSIHGRDEEGHQNHIPIPLDTGQNLDASWAQLLSRTHAS